MKYLSMKISGLVLLLSLFLPNLATAQSQKTISSEVTDVTVYLDGAAITRTARVALNTGVTEVKITGLSNTIDASSLQVTGGGNATILSAGYQVNYLEPVDNPIVLQLTDSSEMLQYQIEKLENQQAAFGEELNLIIANRNFGGKENAIDAIDLEDMADFFRIRITDVKNMITEMNLRIKELKEDLKRIQNQLNQYRSGKDFPAGEITIAVSASSYTNATFNISYYNRNAGWIPVYDLRAENINSPVKLQYKANVWQNTGVEWPNVKLTLSTGRPTLSGSLPQIHPWYLNFNEMAGNQVRYQKPLIKRESEMAMEDMESTAAYTQVQENQLNVSFIISIPYSIPSDGKPRQVSIQDYNLPTSFQYAAVPRLDQDAFLIAKVSGWEQYHLLPGVANLFFEGSYVGESFINPEITSDTLSLSFGRDKKIVIERKQVRSQQDKSFFGGKKKQLFVYEISIRNTKSEAVTIEIKDQIPVSQNKEIKIDLEDAGGARLEQNTGILVWNVNLEPGTEKVLQFKYQVEYPSDKQVPGL